MNTTYHDKPKLEDGDPRHNGDARGHAGSPVQASHHVANMGVLDRDRDDYAGPIFRKIPSVDFTGAEATPQETSEGSQLVSRRDSSDEAQLMHPPPWIEATSGAQADNANIHRFMTAERRRS